MTAANETFPDEMPESVRRMFERRRAERDRLDREMAEIDRELAIDVNARVKKRPKYRPWSGATR